MNRTATRILTAATLSATVLGAAPATATSYGISVSIPGISFSYNSGGYCDAWGCPDSYWDYPIYYCPVYYGGQWYRGPVYYRVIFGRRFFWLHGDWRRDAWMGPRPVWACVDRFGPPLDLDFYIWNGFFVRDDWRYAWRNHRNDWWRHRRDWDREHHNDRNWQAWLPPAQRNYDWNRERDWSKDRDWTRKDWNRRDWERKNHIDRGTQQPTAVVPPAISPPTQVPGRIRPWRGGPQGSTSSPGAGQPSGLDRNGPATTQPTRAPNWQPNKNRGGGQNWSGEPQGSTGQDRSGAGHRPDKTPPGHEQDRNEKGKGHGGP